MIIIDDKIIADNILSEQFNCNLKSCKGQCCVEGVCGAPLNEDEKTEIINAFPFIKNSLNSESIKEIEAQGLFINLEEHGLVTPTIDDGICVYGIKDKAGTVLCAFEKAFYEGKISWKKPISCHLFPIRITPTKEGELLNLELLDICASACSFGIENKIKVFRFLKEALIRKYGKAFYDALEEMSNQYKL